jgi:hypothetical protein
MNTITANGPPNDSGRFVTRMKIGPRRLSACSFAASEAETEEAGYSPPVPANVCQFMILLLFENTSGSGVPNPIVPRATVIIQNMPLIVFPFDAVARMPPTTIMTVVMTMAHLRPR